MVLLCGLALGGLPARVQAQAVSSLSLSEPIFADGIRFDADGSLIACGGFRGTSVYRIAMDGEVTELASGFVGPTQSARDAQGRLYVTNYSDSGTVAVVDVGGDQAIPLATVPKGVAGIATGPDGNLYVSIYGDQMGSGDAVYRVMPDGEAEVFVHGEPIAAPIGLVFGPDGTLYVANSRDGRIHGVDAAGSVSLLAQLPSGGGFFATGHLVFGNGKLYASGNHHHRIYEIDLNGEVRVLAGTGKAGAEDGPANEATFTVPNGLAVSPDGSRLYVMPGGRPPRTALRIIELR